MKRQTLHCWNDVKWNAPKLNWSDTESDFEWQAWYLRLALSTPRWRKQLCYLLYRYNDAMVFYTSLREVYAISFLMNGPNLLSARWNLEFVTHKRVLLFFYLELFCSFLCSMVFVKINEVNEDIKFLYQWFLIECDTLFLFRLIWNFMLVW